MDHHHIAFTRLKLESAEQHGAQKCKKAKKVKSQASQLYTFFLGEKDSSHEIRWHLRERPLTPLKLYSKLNTQANNARASVRCIPSQAANNGHNEPLIR
jgi:hypothetical protein